MRSATLRVVVLFAAVLLACGPGAPAAVAAGPPATCARAKALLDAGYRADAEAVYKELLGVTACPAGDVAAAQPTRAQLTQQAKRLQDAGFDGDARVIAKQLAAGGPIDASLRDPAQRMGWWQRLLAAAGPWARTALEALALLLVAAVVGAVLASRIPRRLRLGEFSGGGAGLAAQLGDTLEGMRDGRTRATLTYQAATEPTFTLPATVTGAVPQGAVAGAVLELLDRLVPRRTLTVTGTAHPIHRHRGAGLTLAVVDARGKTRTQVTIWERDFVLKSAGELTKDEVRYERLIQQAAVWLAYQRFDRFARWGKERKYLGTTDWRSYAMSAIGDLIPDPVDRRRVYELALDRDEGNLVARLNLAALLMRHRGPGAHVGGRSRRYPGETPEERLRAAAELLTSVIGDNDVDPPVGARAAVPIYYRACYLLALCRLDRDEPGLARDVLARPLALQLRVKQPRGGDGALDHNMAETFAILDCEVRLANGDTTAQPPDGLWFSAQAQYALARFWARRARHDGHVDPTVLPRVWAAMRSAVERGGTDAGTDFRADFRGDPTFKRVRNRHEFWALVNEPAQQEEADKPERHAVTVDSGEQLTKLLSGALNGG